MTTVCQRHRDKGESMFVTTRPRLFAIAYRLLGDVGEAEDVVQETWLRWERADRSVVINPPAFLAITTTRLALNVVKSARKRRETYAGPWLVEWGDSSAGQEAAAEQHEAVDVAVRLLLEKLTPAERAAYILRKAFDYPYRRISEVLHLAEAHARQLVRRAHERLSTDRSQPVDTATYQQLVRAFLDAARTGDLGDLEGLLAADIPLRKTA
ncbi:sigma-70 family RNA polymerase sigma factor [Nonomuraea sp. JJY05]|jgi:RNA polymerase sigma-70 factor (ECF subfamily)|uniref:sigma-70 family RNA polymerase sigma factor n=1 Tax=Nonomuraea sp. JJY05 TaxID=3350255 RepID=UPI00373F6E04